MVTIAKSPKGTRASIVRKKSAVFIALVLLLWIGVHWFSWFTSVVLGSEQRDAASSIGSGPTLRTTDDGNQQKQQQLAKSILKRLDQLSVVLPLEGDDSTAAMEEESKFIAAVIAECIPGRDDSGGEVNPTTKRKRECLRHVPSGEQTSSNNLDLEERTRRQKPRIGIMIPPGYISLDFARWIEGALKRTGEELRMDVEILITSHVPVYGYGKSHGFTKLIRLATLPAPLAAYDAYLWSYHAAKAAGSDSHHDIDRDSSLHNALESVKSGPLFAAAIGRILQLVMRWHCRLSRELTPRDTMSCFKLLQGIYPGAVTLPRVDSSATLC